MWRNTHYANSGAFPQNHRESRYYSARNFKLTYGAQISIGGYQAYNTKITTIKSSVHQFPLQSPDPSPPTTYMHPYNSHSAYAMTTQIPNSHRMTISSTPLNPTNTEDRSVRLNPQLPPREDILSTASPGIWLCNCASCCGHRYAYN